MKAYCPLTSKHGTVVYTFTPTPPPIFLSPPTHTHTQIHNEIEG